MQIWLRLHLSHQMKPPELNPVVCMPLIRNPHPAQLSVLKKPAWPKLLTYRPPSVPRRVLRRKPIHPLLWSIPFLLRQCRCKRLMLSCQVSLLSRLSLALFCRYLKCPQQPRHLMYPQLRQRDDDEPGIMAEMGLDPAQVDRQLADLDRTR